MIVVADAGPLQYFVRIGAIEVLEPLYQRVLVPQSVASELQQNNTPAAVHAWMAQPPAWCEVRPDPPADPTLAFLDPGERAAIPLAISVRGGPPVDRRLSWARRSNPTPPACDRHLGCPHRRALGRSARF